MPGWKIQPTKKIDLPEDIADGLWISIVHPKMLTFDVMDKMMSMSTGESGDLTELTGLATTFIVDWNLPDGDGRVLKVPKDDPEVWKKIPIKPIIETIFKAVNEGTKELEPDPNSFDGSASS